MSARERAALLSVAAVLVAAPFLRGGRDAAALPLALGLAVLALVVLSVEGRSAAVAGRWPTRPAVWLVGFLAVAAVSWTISVNRFATSTGLLELIAVAAFVWAGAWLRGRRRAVAAFLVAVAAVVALIGLVWSSTADGFRRIASVMDNANALGGFLVLPLILTIPLLASARGMMWGVVVAATTVIGVALILSGSVTALVPVVIGLVVLWLVSGRPRHRVVLIAVAAVIVIGATILLPLARSSNLWNAETRLISVKQRASFLTATWGMLVDRPWLGSGYNTWGIVQPKYQATPLEKPLYAHSWFAQTVAETGVAGGIALLGLIITVVLAVRTALRQSDDPPFDRAVVAGLVAATLNGGSDFGWNFLAVSIPVALFVGIAMTGRRQPSADAAALPSRWRGAARATGILTLLVAAGLALALFYGRSLQTAAREQLKTGNIDGAKKSFEQSLATAPDPNIRRDLANLIVETESGTTALATARDLAGRAATDDPFDGRTHHLLALIALKNNDPDTAERELRIALDVDLLNNPVFALDLAALFAVQNRWSEVTALLEDYLERYRDNRPYELNPDLPRQLAEMHRWLARAALAQDDPSTAAEHIRKAQQEDPSLQLTDEERGLLTE